MGSDIFLALSIAALGLVPWWFGMFSDSGFGQMARAMSKRVAYGKNAFALFHPVAGGMCLLWGLALISKEVGFPRGVVRFFEYSLLVCLVGCVIALFPIPLPRWMYPEYHLAKRERVRAERLARGEVVKMPSSGRVAVEAQRLEQIVREQEAAKRADKDESSR